MAVRLFSFLPWWGRRRSFCVFSVSRRREAESVPAAENFQSCVCISGFRNCACASRRGLILPGACDPCFVLDPIRGSFSLKTRKVGEGFSYPHEVPLRTAKRFFKFPAHVGTRAATVGCTAAAAGQRPFSFLLCTATPLSAVPRNVASRNLQARMALRSRDDLADLHFAEQRVPFAVWVWTGRVRACRCEKSGGSLSSGKSMIPPDARL